MLNGKALRRARFSKGWRQTDLADKARCCKNTVSIAERQGRCSAKLAKRFAEALEIAVSVLYRPDVEKMGDLSPREQRVVQIMRRTRQDARRIHMFALTLTYLEEEEASESEPR